MTWGCSFGDNTLGQLGRRQSHERPRELDDWLVCDSKDLPLRVSQVAAGLAHNLALTVDGHVFTWGWNGIALNSTFLLKYTIRLHCRLIPQPLDNFFIVMV